jgi:hypothetical protein
MIFTEENTSYSLLASPINSEAILHTGLWLTLIGIDDIPPHIALINEEKYYSLSTRKVDCGSSSERFMNMLKRKHIPTLLIRIETRDNTAFYLEKIYKDLHLLGTNENTCLSPIKDFFARFYSTEFASVNYVFELLALAEKKNLLKESMSLFCESAGTNNVTLPKYTMVAIKNKIRMLSSQIPFIK